MPQTNASSTIDGPRLLRTGMPPVVPSFCRVSLASVVRASETLGESLAGDRLLGREDRTVLGTMSIVILVIAVVAAFIPVVVGWVVAGVAAWFGLATGVRAYVQARRARLEERRALMSPETE